MSGTSTESYPCPILDLKKSQNFSENFYGNTKHKKYPDLAIQYASVAAFSLPYFSFFISHLVKLFLEIQHSLSYS